MSRNDTTNIMSTLWKMKQKKGASLPMVMMIGAALVIWVLALMPLITASGTKAEETSKMEQDYLDSRSAIEFAKSELTKIVENELPYTFAVLDASNTYEYSVVPKKESNYGTYVQSGTTDVEDAPKSNAVVAICAVTLSEDGLYDITITTYHNGKEDLTYVAYYTLGGNMLIYPESYKQTEALPLSDFVVVDGIMGGKNNGTEPNVVWDSNIHDTYNYTNYYDSSNKAYQDGYKEWFQPWKLTLLSGEGTTYANTGRFPSVFKTTAHASVNDAEVDYIDRSGDDDEAETPVTGGIRLTSTMMHYNVNASTRAITITADGCTIDMDKVTIYVNGTQTNKIPNRPGAYQIVVDYLGSGNVLPAKGLAVGIYKEGKLETLTQNIESAYIEINGNQVTINPVTTDDGQVISGYTTESNPDAEDITWVPSNSIDIGLVKNNCYFYCYLEGYVDPSTGKVYEQSSVVYAGSVIYNKGTKLSANSNAIGTSGSYMIVSDNYHALYNNNGTLAQEHLPTYSVAEYGDNYVWNVQSDTTKTNWSFANGGKYINLESVRQSNGSESEGLLYRKYYYKYGYNAVLGNAKLEFLRNGDTFSRTKPETSWEKIGNITGNVKESGTADFTGYLDPSAGTMASANSANVYFMVRPTIEPGKGSAENPGNIMNPGSVSANATSWTRDYDSQFKETSLITELAGDYNIVELYLNSQNADSTKTLMPGVYSVMAKVEKNGFYYGVEFGELTVNRSVSSLTTDLNLNLSDNYVDIEYAGWTNTDAIKYFGYQHNGVQYWFVYDKNNINVLSNLPVKEDIKIGVAQSATLYKASESVKWVDVKINNEKLDLSGTKNDFVYALKSTKKPHWYRLPLMIKHLEDQIQFCYGVENGSRIEWSNTYGAGVTKYGVMIPGTTCEDEPMELNAPLPISPEVTVLENDIPVTYYASYLKGRSMYFMDDDTSIHTHGTSVSLHTDLLVLNHGIVGGGNLYVYPYRETAGAQDTMLFAVNDIYDESGTKIFREKNFYLIPRGTDLTKVNPETAEREWLRKDPPSEGHDGSTKIETTNGIVTNIVFPKVVKNLFRTPSYPMINLDIAYATNEQLAHVISGEAIGWVTNGHMQVPSSATNELYVVCAYADKIVGNVNARANRVLLATNAELSVPGSTTFMVRYLSLDMSNLIQETAGASFVVKNILQDSTLFNAIKEALKANGFDSGTMQVDYENSMMITKYAAEPEPPKQIPIEASICRYKDPTNLFGTDSTTGADLVLSDKEELTVDHEISKIRENFISEGLAALKNLAVVDRYINITGSEVFDTTSQKVMGIHVSKDLTFYANYLQFDDMVRKVIIKETVGGPNDIYINSQESGYTDAEYLGFFKVSQAENYSGTLMHVKSDMTVVYDKIVGRDPEYKIDAGYYLIPAISTNDYTTGTSFLSIAQDVHQNGESSRYYVDPDDLAESKVIIDPTMSDSFIDSGIENGQSAVAGFGGGAVK